MRVGHKILCYTVVTSARCSRRQSEREGDSVTEQGSGPVELPVFWVGVEDTDTLSANQFSITRDEDRGDFILTFGMAATPILTGPPEQMREQAKRIPYVPVRIVGRFGLSSMRLRQLTEMLKTIGERVDAQEREGGEGRA